MLPMHLEKPHRSRVGWVPDDKDGPLPALRCLKARGGRDAALIRTKSVPGSGRSYLLGVGQDSRLFPTRSQ